MRTRDGGATWQNQGQNVVDVPPVLRDVAAIDERRAIAVGAERVVPDSLRRGPVVLHSDVGGATWRRSVLPPIADAEKELYEVCVVNGGLAIASGSSFKFAEALILITHGFGRTWTDVSERLPHLAAGSVACGVNACGSSETAATCAYRKTVAKPGSIAAAVSRSICAF